MKIIGYKEGHLDFLEPKPGYFEDKGSIEKAIKELYNTFAVSLVDKNIVVAVLGITEKRPGICECWSIISDESKKRPIAFYKATKSLIEQYEKKLNIVRLEMTVRFDLADACKFARSLGFIREGLMRKYGVNGEDFFLYSRVNNG